MDHYDASNVRSLRYNLPCMERLAWLQSSHSTSRDYMLSILEYCSFYSHLVFIPCATKKEVWTGNSNIHMVQIVVLLLISTEKCVKHDTRIATAGISMDNGICTSTATRIEFVDIGKNIEKYFNQLNAFIYSNIDSYYHHQFITCILVINNHNI